MISQALEQLTTFRTRFIPNILLISMNFAIPNSIPSSSCFFFLLSGDRNGLTTTKIYTKNMTGQLYGNVLETEMKRFMAKLPKKTKMIYQENFVPWQVSNIAKDKIASLQLIVLGWAPKDPDFNPIDMLWSILDKRLT